MEDHGVKFRKGVTPSKVRVCEERSDELSINVLLHNVLT